MPEPTEAELLFGAAALDEALVASAIDARDAYVPGPRSALCPAECPYDFPDTDAIGGTLTHVYGPPAFPLWSAAYSVVADTRPCPWCNEPIVQLHGQAGRNATLGFWSDAPNARERWRFYHPVCAVESGGRGVTAMGIGFERRTEKPDCARCGLPWGEHESFGYETRSCADMGLYEHAAGTAGVPRRAWQVSHDDEGCVCLAAPVSAFEHGDGDMDALLLTAKPKKQKRAPTDESAQEHAAA